MISIRSMRRLVAPCNTAVLLSLVLLLTAVSFPSPALAQANANEQIFRQRVDSALDAVRTLLESSKSPRRILDPSDVDHEFDDKYSLAEYLINVAVAASVNAFDRLGIGEDLLLRLKQQHSADGNNIKLRFSANETCSFVEKKTVEIVDASRKETYETSSSGEPRKVEEKTTTTNREVIEYHWQFNLAYKLAVSAGPIESTISSHSGSETIVVTGSERAPCQPQYAPPNLDVDLQWLLLQLSAEMPFQSSFRINRDVPSCLTPRRNEDVEKAMEYFEKLLIWARGVSQYFQFQLVHRIMPYQQSHTAKKPVHNDELEAQPYNIAELFRSISDTSVFVPVLPLFQDNANNNSTAPVLSASDVDVLLREQCQTMDSACSTLSERFQGANESRISSSVEARVVLITKHLSSLAVAARDGMTYVEDMLRSQLVSAIGREISPKDFEEFVSGYYPKIFRADFVPKPFVYAVRRPKHYPDGALAIETATSSGGWNGDNNGFEPIHTFSRRIKPTSEGSALGITMPINAATKIQLEGDQYLHSWMRHDIAGMNAPAQLVARARQFSSFLLVLGKISGESTFQPKSAIVVQNKDEVILPLLVEPLPTPKEFKDAIQSLSPEQRDFAKAFRAMQLESSVFAVAVVQLKPQLEFILGLPHDSLAKETKLTQELLELFITYQISPDQLSFDGDKDADIGEKLKRIKDNVAVVQSMIDEAKEKELKEAERQSDMKAGGKKYNRVMMESRSREDDWGDDELVEDVHLMHMDMPVADVMEADMMHAEASAAPKVQRRSVAGKRRLMAASIQSSSAASVSSHGSGQHLRAKEVPSSMDSDGFDQAASPESPVGNTLDLSQMAKKFDAAFDAYDADSVLRPTKISVQEDASWVRNHQKTLLSPQEKAFLSQDDKRREKDSAFDLLDALSRSGAQPIQYSELHVIVAATHRFDRSIIETAIQTNTNPIVSVERSALIVASTLHDVPVADLLLDQGKEHLALRHSPHQLLEIGKKKGREAEIRTEERQHVEPALL